MQPTHYLLIDYENLQPNLMLISDLPFIRVITFIGATQKAIAFDFAFAMQRLGNRAIYIKSKSGGTNALDFYIAFYLAILMKRDPKAYFYIISNDTGFDSLIQHLREKHLKIYRFARIEDLPCLQKTFVTTNQQVIDTTTPQPASSTMANTNGAKPSVDAFLQRFVEHLRNPSISRPSTLTRLRNHLLSIAKQQLTFDEAETIIALLFAKNYISLEEGASQRLRYHL